jgi:predicted nucleic acid-binding protein
MTDWLVVDASVIVKAFIAENDSDAAARIWSSTALLAAPSHALAEVGEVLRRKLLQSQITESQLAQASIELPRSLVSVGLEELFGPAMEMARRVRLSFYDCLYVVAAEKLDCLFVTADEKLIAIAGGGVWRARVRALREYTDASSR